MSGTGMPPSIALQRTSSAFALRSASLEHLEDARARDEADAGVVGDDEVAGLDPDFADLHRAVDLDRLEPPLAGDRADLARPQRIADRARMGDVADRPHHDGAGLALALAGLGGDAAHVGDRRHALDHQHVAGGREIVRLELRHAVDGVRRAFQRIDPLQHVAHGQRRPDDGGAGNGRLEDRGADHAQRECRARPWRRRSPRSDRRSP